MREGIAALRVTVGKQIVLFVSCANEMSDPPRAKIEAELNSLIRFLDLCDGTSFPMSSL
jgi:hypothetical protein